ncbi:xaa-Pro aminopeptidase 1-like isoform X2 [Neodiprion fabricii]|uniref:xaa-Pro aminopeptidase 1-like isoform X2 n=1 Tax=Neodiprion fabricii TaxID=2872261 RepID=UPI001ED8C564|nr:xaa-Pro aminopeptidase 1-like isoform X2 [Neodiprion fabricii]
MLVVYGADVTLTGSKATVVLGVIQITTGSGLSAPPVVAFDFQQETRVRSSVLRNGMAAAARTRNIRDVADDTLDYKGSPRSNCPASAHQGNQPVDRVDTSINLSRLRLEMSRITSVQGPALDGYIVTSDDAHQTVTSFNQGRLGPSESETVAPHDARREYITGFFGSFGEALVTQDKAVFWTDGRYHIQADKQLSCDWTLMKLGNENVPTLSQWLLHEFQSKENETRIGADPALIPAFTWENWEYDLLNTSVKLVAVHNNLIDAIWQTDRPPYNADPATVLEDKYAGRPWQEKIREVRREMELVGANALVLTALDEIAWLFNIRGNDIPYTPVLRSYALITDGAIHLYAPEQKLHRSVRIHLKTDACFHADCVKVHNYTSIWYDLRTMAQAWKSVWLPAQCGYARGASQEIFISIPQSIRLIKPSPIIAMRAVKNPVEIRGMEQAHIRDGIAMCEILSYIEEQLELGTKGWDELQVSRFAKAVRMEQENAVGISFPTIAGYGPHAALPHYEPAVATSLTLGTDSTLVIDSGGQYLDGTTDVTRTVHYGQPTKEQKEAYTRVLIGSIQLASLIFPAELRTDQLDLLVREPLWSVGRDYQHGTGHGVGHYLSVHEPPISVSYDTSTDECAPVNLQPGYFLSNEPGYYKEGEFGIRLENVLQVVETNMTHHSGRKFLKFKDVTLVPYEPKLIDLELLTPSHRHWLNAYNERIRKEVGTELKKRRKISSYNWMILRTLPIPEVGSGSSLSALPHHSFLFFALTVTHVFLDGRGL